MEQELFEPERGPDLPLGYEAQDLQVWEKKGANYAEYDETFASKERRSEDAEWHRNRAKAMLKKYPALIALRGPRPIVNTLLCLGCAAGHVGVAIAVAHQPIWIAILAAWLVGWWFVVQMILQGHECQHQMVYKSKRANSWLFLLTTLPKLGPTYYDWCFYHHPHHFKFGTDDDVVIKRRDWLLRGRPLSPLFMPYTVLNFPREVLHFVLKDGPKYFGQLFDSKLPMKQRRAAGWAIVYFFAVVGLAVALFMFFGISPVIYLLAATCFQTGFLHPMSYGMRLFISHFGPTTNKFQASYIYENTWFNTLFNWLTVNWGLHCQHHDFPNIPWTRLGKVAKIAPDFYQDIVRVKSYLGLTWLFHFSGAKRGHLSLETLKNAAKGAETAA
jgi:sphingolipid 4-desaturase/C4-monooxygenase